MLKRAVSQAAVDNSKLAITVTPCNDNLSWTNYIKDTPLHHSPSADVSEGTMFNKPAGTFSTFEVTKYTVLNAIVRLSLDLVSCWNAG